MACYNVWVTSRVNTRNYFYLTFLLADLFFMRGDIDIANFTADNTPYTSAKNIDDVIESLEQASMSLFKWFGLNLLKGNADKFHFITSTC